jgi:hypothetical protein
MQFTGIAQAIPPQQGLPPGLKLVWSVHGDSDGLVAGPSPAAGPPGGSTTTIEVTDEEDEVRSAGDWDFTLRLEDSYGLDYEERNLSTWIGPGTPPCSPTGLPDLNDSEKAALQRLGIRKAEYVALAGEAMLATSNLFGKSCMGDPKPGNAYQHAMWGCFASVDWGEAKAREMLGAHEDCRQACRSGAMDLQNNEVGISLGTTIGSKLQCHSKVIQALVEGDLWWAYAWDEAGCTVGKRALQPGMTCYPY